MAAYISQPDRKVRQLARLEELAEVGMELVRALRLNPGRDAALAFDRLSRAIRMTIALDARFCEPADDWDDIDLSRIGKTKPARLRPENLDDEEDYNEVETFFAPDRLRAERDRPDPDEWTLVREKPAAEIAQIICKTLGATYEPELWETRVPPNAPPPGELAAKRPEGAAASPPKPPPQQAPSVGFADTTPARGGGLRPRPDGTGPGP